MIDEQKQLFIRHSCQEFGQLDEAATETIIDVAKMLDLFSLIYNYEVFIDIKVANEDFMFVVAEQLSKKSYYEYSFLGDFIYRENEPAVFEAYATAEVQESIGVSQNKKTGGKIITNQRAIPIVHGQAVVAILILEKSIDVNGVLPAPSLVRTKLISDIMLSLMEAKAEGVDLQIHEGVMFFDHEGGLLYANKYCEDLYRSFGFSSLLDHRFDTLNLSPLQFAELLNAFSAKKADSAAAGPAAAGANKDAGYLDLSPLDQKAETEVSFFQEETVGVGPRFFRIRFVVLADIESFVIMFIDDITQSENPAKSESTYLVTTREMQHRIKNNLMTVASLLNLQSRQCENAEAKKIIELGVNRILAISATFELLSQSGSSAVLVLDLLRSIRDNHLALATNDLELQIMVDGENFLLDSDRSTTLGLVVNELIQNSIKHAFGGRGQGRIEVMTASDGDVKLVQVSDDGSGFDPTVEKAGSFGLVIITGLVKDNLHGKIKIESSADGTTVFLAFKQYDGAR